VVRFGLTWPRTFLGKYKSVLPGSNGTVVVEKGIPTGGQSCPEQKGRVELAWQKDNFCLSVTFGVNNVAGKTPPICPTCGGYDSGMYDLLGQFAYLRVAYKQ
jgi:hypothetical protein